jgi:hypothetical protein
MGPVGARHLALQTKWSEGMKYKYDYRHDDYCVSVVRLLFRPQK